MKKLVLSLLLLSVFTLGCKKNNPEPDPFTGDDKEVCMQRAGTQCADPWMTRCPPEDTKEQRVTSYLKGKGIKVLGISVEQTDPGMVCAACTCPSGETVFIKVKARDKAKAEAEGFKAGDCAERSY